MGKNICVYCSSSDFVDKKYFMAAKELGEMIAEYNYNLVYGGSVLGLMGEVALNVKKNGGKVLGVVPKKIHEARIDFPKDIELIITKDMRERKQTMENHADAFITLPGGFGTLEEVSEMIVAKQLGYHFKPLVFLNIDNFFGKLFEFYDYFYKEKFARGDVNELFFRANNPKEALEYIKNYKVTEDKDKWAEKFIHLSH